MTPRPAADRRHHNPAFPPAPVSTAPAVAAALALLTLAACSKAPPAPSAAVEAPSPLAVDRARAKALFGTPPGQIDSPANPITAEKVALGRQLFHDPRLSRDGDVACSSCHSLATFGVDSAPTSTGHRGQRGARNSPSVLFAAAHFVQFWDGRAADVEEQAKGPILNPIEMAMPDPGAVEARVAAVPGYVAGFTAAFPEQGAAAVTFDNIAKAIAAFERTLQPPAPFDAWLAGDDSALSAAELHGLSVFVDAGCIACHMGPLFGATSYRKLGLVEKWPHDADKGRGAFTGDAKEELFFKVPSLRNVAKTGPYFHDGQTADLGEAVRMMALHQLGKRLDAAQVGAIVAFLGSLTSVLPPSLLAAPTRPADGPTVPTVAPEAPPPPAP